MSSPEIRVGLVGPLPPPSGGMAMQTLQLARILGDEGIRVELVQTNPPYRPRPIAHLRGLRALFRLVPYLWRVWTLAGRSDVIHVMANSGWAWQLFAAPVVWAGWFRRTPVIVNYRGGEARQYLTRSIRWIRPTLSKATRLVVPSGYLEAVFREFSVGSAVIPNIVDLELFRPAMERLGTEAFTLVVARNLEPIYGIDNALRAFSLARQIRCDLQLKIAGSGPQLETLQCLANELGIADAVTFLGRLDREGIVTLYHSADAMLNPSRVDNMPNSILEALASGLPVISTHVGGVPYMVQDAETALLVPADDPQAMASAILRLADDAELRGRLRSRGIEEVAQYSWAEVRPLWLGLYQQLVDAV